METVLENSVRGICRALEEYQEQEKDAGRNQYSLFLEFAQMVEKKYSEANKLQKEANELKKLEILEMKRANDFQEEKFHIEQQRKYWN